MENNSFGRSSFFKTEKLIILVLRSLFFLYILGQNLWGLVTLARSKIAKKQLSRGLSFSSLFQVLYVLALSLFMWTYLFELLRGQFLNPSHTDASIFDVVQKSHASLKYNVFLLSYISFFNLFSLLKILNNFFFHYLNLIFRSFSKAKKDIIVYFSVA